jgi:hypothetical protein
MKDTIIRLFLGFLAIGAGFFGICNLHNTPATVKNGPMIAFLLIISILMLGIGEFLLTESKLQEKTKTKQGEV